MKFKFKNKSSKMSDTNSYLEDYPLDVKSYIEKKTIDLLNTDNLKEDYNFNYRICKNSNKLILAYDSSGDIFKFVGNILIIQNSFTGLSFLIRPQAIDINFCSVIKNF